jgi:hypothetical protein
LSTFEFSESVRKSKTNDFLFLLEKTGGRGVDKGLTKSIALRF